ncbi:MAG TPA: hypothetical protein VMV18_11790 [bacterium]|nr:hypothetical protein [bacterium]
MRRALRAALLVALTGAVLVIACKEGPRDGAGQAYTATPTPSSSPNATPQPIALGTSAAGAILSPGATALYTLAVASAGIEVSLDVDAETLGSNMLLDGRITVFGPDGSFLAAADDGKTVKDPHAMRDPFLAFTAPGVGTYTVAVDDAHGAGGATGYGYVLHAAQVHAAPNPGGNSCVAATMLTNLNLSISGDTTGGTSNCCGATQVLSCVGAAVPGPESIYKAYLSSGQSFEAVRTGAAFDGAIYVASTCGSPTVIQSTCLLGGDGHDQADGIVFRPAVTGTYYLYVDSVNAAGQGAFQVHLRTF